MAEPEEDAEVVAMRERAEKVAARRAKERAEGVRPEKDDEPKKKSKKRRWYHNVIDAVLIALVIYMVKTRFFDKPKEPEPLPKGPSSPSASASAAPKVFTKASADVFENAQQPAAKLETLAPKTPVEVLELSNSGFMKVKTPSGKVGWIAAPNVSSAP
jgi:hypothetical protein